MSIKSSLKSSEISVVKLRRAYKTKDLLHLSVRAVSLQLQCVSTAPVKLNVLLNYYYRELQKFKQKMTHKQKYTFYIYSCFLTCMQYTYKDPH